LMHGLEPGHGWPIAVVYSSSRSRRMVSALSSSALISSAHFVSSIAVVVAYVLFSSVVTLPPRIMSAIAAGLLAALGVSFIRERPQDREASQHGHTHLDMAERILHEHEHEHPESGEVHTHPHLHEEREVLTLRRIGVVAFLLGFAHEEEFALLGLVIAGLNPWLLMVSYGLAVTFSLVAATLIGVKMFEAFESKIARYEAYLPKISGLVLLVMAAAFAIQTISPS